MWTATETTSPPGGTVRRGKSLIEILIVITIVAILVGLVLGVVQKIRLRAALLRDENSFRQVVLATHEYQSEHGRLPPLAGHAGLPQGYHDPIVPVAALLLPYLEQPPASTLWLPANVGEPAWVSHVVPAYVSSSDPSHADGRVVLSALSRLGVGNVAFNVQVFGPRYEPCGVIGGKTSLTNSIPDGASNTLVLATKRGRCGTISEVKDPNGVWHVLDGGSRWASDGIKGRCLGGGPDLARVTNAAMFGQVLPAADGTGSTFQVQPDEAECDPDLAQGFHAGIITVGMSDGSVRRAQAGLDPKLWRAGLLPNDGAALMLD